MVQIPRKEYPRPQFERENWLNLNGEWAFEMDNGRSGEARGLYQEGAALADKILVPFCPESELSGIGHKDFMYGVWYKRTVSLTEAQLSGRVILHFGAVDYHCKAYVNGVLAGEHKGGYVSFAFDVTVLLRPGANEITVYAEDNTRDRLIPSGKQSHEFKSFGCFYTRTTGIWQTVWMEFLPTEHIERVKYHPNIADGSVTVEAALCGTGDFKAEIFFADEKMGEYTAENTDGTLHFTVALKESTFGKSAAAICMTCGLLSALTRSRAISACVRCASTDTSS